MRHVIALDVGGTGMKAALVGADGTLLHEARRPTGRERGPDAVVESILDFAAELRAYGERALRRERRRGRGRRARHRRRRARHRRVRRQPRLARRTHARAAQRAAAAACRSRSGTTCAPAASPRGGIGAGKGADRFLFVPAGHRHRGRHRHRRPGRAGRARLRRARSATSSYAPAASSAPAVSAAAWRRLASAAAVTPAWADGERRPGRRTPPTAPRPSSPATRARSRCGTTRSTRSPTAWSPHSPCWTPAC